jgi:hypothetical protein
MIDMTRMIAIEPQAFLRSEGLIRPQSACRLLSEFAPDLCQFYQQYASACTFVQRQPPCPAATTTLAGL